jgi:hypothetical protein
MRKEQWDEHDGYPDLNCLEGICAWWNPKGNFNPEIKKYDGECCIKTLSKLKLNGIINTHQS